MTFIYNLPCMHTFYAMGRKISGPFLFMILSVQGAISKHDTAVAPVRHDSWIPDREKLHKIQRLLGMEFRSSSWSWILAVLLLEHDKTAFPTPRST